MESIYIFATLCIRQSLVIENNKSCLRLLVTLVDRLDTTTGEGPRYCTLNIPNTACCTYVRIFENMYQEAILEIE